MPTSANVVDLSSIAKACNYQYVASVESLKNLDEELLYIRDHRQLSFLEIKTAIGSKDDLGRPKTSPLNNKSNFMKILVV